MMLNKVKRGATINENLDRMIDQLALESKVIAANCLSKAWRRSSGCGKASRGSSIGGGLLKTNVLLEGSIYRVR